MLCFPVPDIPREFLLKYKLSFRAEIALLISAKTMPEPDFPVRKS